MIINKFVSSKEIINQVYRDLGSTEELPYGDLLSWIYEALQLMRMPQQYVKKVTGHKANPNLDITNYRAELPCDFHKLVQIAVNGLPARYSGYTFHHLLAGDCCGLGTPNSDVDTFVDNLGNSYSPQASSLFTATNLYDTVTFDINDNYLTLSVKEGQVCIAYLAHPVDEEGWPMFPDDMSYRQALTRYIIYKLSYINWIKDAANAGKRAIFEHADKEWCWYVGQAINTVKVPDIEEMESLKNQYLRLATKVNMHDNFFKELGSKENLKRH